MLKAGAQEGRSIARVGVVLGLLLASLVVVIRAANGWNPVVNDVEGFVVDDLALGSVLAAPPLLAWLGIRGRTPLLLVAGVTTLLVAVPLSIAGLLLVVPALLYLAAFGRASKPGASGGLRRSLTAVACGVGLMASFGLFIAGSSQTVCWTKTTYVDGRVVWNRDGLAERSGILRGGPPTAGVVSDEGGCDGAVLPAFWGMSVIALVGVILALGQNLPPDVEGRTDV